MTDQLNEMILPYNPRLEVVRFPAFRVGAGFPEPLTCGPSARLGLIDTDRLLVITARRLARANV